MNIAEITDRRSVSPRRLVEPGPDTEQIDAMIEAACSAPDHRRLHPWRFVLIRNEERSQLEDLFESAARETHGILSDVQCERAREKARNGACLIAVVARISDNVNDVPPHEQWVSVGAAVQNILLAAKSLGFGSMIVSGGKVATQALRTGLGISDGEHLLGFIAVGTADKKAPELTRPATEDVLTVWP
jgi:nitroreductase